MEIIPPDEYEHLPKRVRRHVEELMEHIETAPEVTRISGGYRISLTSKRVYLTCDYLRGSRPGTWTYNSTLTVDGTRHPLAKSLLDFVTIWNDPDITKGLDGRLDRIDFTTLPDANIPALAKPSGPAPAIVDNLYRTQLPDIDKRGGTAELGQHGDEWQILITVPTPGGRRVQAYMVFQPNAAGHYSLAVEQVTAIFAINGKDCDGLISDVDLHALGIIPPSPEVPTNLTFGKPRREAGAARMNSVDVRKVTVIRN